MSWLDSYRDKDNGIVPPWILILQTLNLLQAIIFGTTVRNAFIAISLIQLLASAYAAYWIFLIVNSIVVLLMLYTHLYFYFNAKRFWDRYDWDFYIWNSTFFKILFGLSQLIIPLLFYPFLILWSIWNVVDYGSTNEAFLIIFFAGNLLQVIITTLLLLRVYRWNSGSSRITTYPSVLCKVILGIVFTVFFITYLIMTWVWPLDDQENQMTEFVLASIAQWLFWLALFAWHASFFEELSRIDADKEGRLR
ncbi:hypothetical protein P9112_005532 [Eukaryota sp. TZLM1-RC]